MSKKTLNDINLKLTKNRATIINIFENTSIPLCAEDIYKKVNKQINIVTIYRNLNTLTDKRILSKVIFDDGKMYYKLKKSSHTHNLVCSICHNITSIENCPVDLITKNIKNSTGYEITSHSLEFIGVCPNCKKYT